MNSLFSCAHCKKKIDEKDVEKCGEEYYHRGCLYAVFCKEIEEDEARAWESWNAEASKKEQQRQEWDEFCRKDVFGE